MLATSIAVENRSTVLKGKEADVRTVVDALQTQVHRDFAPIWGVSATLRIIAEDEALN